MAKDKWVLRKIRSYGNSFVVSIPHEFVEDLSIKIPQDVVIHLAQGGLFIQPIRKIHGEMPAEFKKLCSLPE